MRSRSRRSTSESSTQPLQSTIPDAIGGACCPTDCGDANGCFGLVLLRHSDLRLPRTGRTVAQHGQRSRVAVKPATMARLSVAIESGT